MDNTTTPDATAPAADPSQTPQLSVVDLANVRDVVDLAARRGAFAAAEMVTVGQIFNKLNAFVNFALPQQTPAPTDETAGQ